MRITVHSVAGKMPSWVEEGVTDYTRRLPRDMKLTWRTVPLARGGGDQRDSEGEALLRGLRDGDHCVALDVKGRPWSTEELAAELRDWMMQGRSLGLLVGGPDGLSEACLKRARQRWSLGPLTLPHPLVRVVLAEQLYRAWSITIGHPYHRA